MKGTELRIFAFDGAFSGVSRVFPQFEIPSIVNEISHFSGTSVIIYLFHFVSSSSVRGGTASSSDHMVHAQNGKPAAETGKLLNPVIS